MSGIADDIRQIVTSSQYKSNYYGLEVLHNIMSKDGFLKLEDPKLLETIQPLVKKDYELSKYGMIYFRNHEYDKALAIYEFNGKLFPKSERPLFSKGLSYYQLGDYERAKENFEEVIKRKPDHKYANKYLLMISDIEQLSSKM